MTGTKAWYEARQAATRPHADRFGIEYTLTELDAIEALRVEGVHVADIALAAGRTYAGVAAIIADHDRFTRTRQTLVRRASQDAACTACWLVHRGECE